MVLTAPATKKSICSNDSKTIYLYFRLQMEMLMKAGKCSSINEELPLIQIRSVMKYMPQFKYMFNRGDMVMPVPAHSSEEHSAKKRQRTS